MTRCPQCLDAVEWLTGRADCYDQDADHITAKMPKLARAIATELRNLARDLEARQESE